MNRAERRRLGVNKQQALSYKQQEEARITAIRKEINGQAAKDLIAVFISVLHDKWGWGHKRTKRLMEHVSHRLKLINEDFVTADDLIQCIKEEVGIDIQK